MTTYALVRSNTLNVRAGKLAIIDFICPRAKLSTADQGTSTCPSPTESCACGPSCNGPVSAALPYIARCTMVLFRTSCGSANIAVVGASPPSMVGLPIRYPTRRTMSSWPRLAAERRQGSAFLRNGTTFASFGVAQYPAHASMSLPRFSNRSPRR